MPLRIVVPVDGSALSEHALRWAVDFTRRTSALLCVCSVVDPMPACVAASGGAALDPGPLIEALEADAGRFCAVAVACAAAANIAATSALLEGAPAQAIDDFARQTAADLIVIGTHARRGLAQGILGSVTAAIVTSSHVPVVAVRAQTRFATTGPVLVAVDDSPSSLAAATLALGIASELGEAIHLVHAVAPSDRMLGPTMALGTIAAQATAMGIACTTETRHGEVVATILSAAGERGASLVASGTHGRGAVERLFLGSVAAGLVRLSEVPVLVVRDAG